MDLERMLDKCREQQWRADDLDWNAKPRPMTRDEEIAVVQYFTDMAAIERFAGALFAEQRRIVEDQTLKQIFATFVVDEERHAQVAERLAAHYNVGRYKEYQVSPALLTFKPHFLDAIKYVSAEVANTYITLGELMLDVALLRSINDFVHDEMSERAMEFVNRDESRHIAMDYYMTEFYASPDYQAWLAKQPRKPLDMKVKMVSAFAGALWHAGPFANQVFFTPLAITDPSGKRLKEAVKRMQILGSRPNVAERPFSKFLAALRDANNHPVWGKYLGGIARRLTANFPEELYRDLASASELKHGRQVSIEQLADEAVQAKYSH